MNKPFESITRAVKMIEIIEKVSVSVFWKHILCIWCLDSQIWLPPSHGRETFGIRKLLDISSDSDETDFGQLVLFA